MSFKLGNIERASIVLAFFSLIAKVSGLYRDRILASQFGASHALDVYYSAFRIPDLVLNLFILGALSSALIPVFIEQRRESQERAWRLAQNFLNVVMAAVVTAAVVLFVFARPLSALIAPGFSLADRILLVKLLRIMLASPILFTIGTILGSFLQSFERFVAYSIAPTVYNIGIIIGALYLAPAMVARGYEPVLGLGLGVVLGAVLHLLVQLPSAIAVGFRLGKVFDLADVNLRKVVRLMIPRTVGLGAYSIDATITNAIASTLSAGSITIFNFANNLQFVPISVLGVSVATAVFPRLSGHAAGNEHGEFRRKLAGALTKTFAIVAPLALALGLARRPVIRLIFQAGAFHGSNVELTASVLGIFMFGVIAQSLIPIMSRAFYAMQNTRTPVLVSLAAIAANVGLGLWFTFGLGWGVRGLAAAFSISGNVNFLLLYVLFRRRYS